MIGEAKKRLGVSADEIEVEAGKELGRAIPAAGAEDGVNRGISKGGVEVGEAVGDRPCVVERARSEGVWCEDGIVPESTQAGEPGFNAGGNRGGGWRDDREACAGTEAGGPAQSRSNL